MSYYKTMMIGNNKKKKVIKEQSKPKKTVLDGIKQDLNEWTNQPPTEKRWSKTFNGNTGLTEFEENGRKDTLNETVPALAREWKNLEKAEKLLYKAVKDIEKAAARVNSGYGNEIRGLWRYVEGPLKKFKELVTQEILRKLQ